jgi:hypothetical protein
MAIRQGHEMVLAISIDGILAHAPMIEARHTPQA